MRMLNAANRQLAPAIMQLWRLFDIESETALLGVFTLDTDNEIEERMVEIRTSKARETEDEGEGKEVTTSLLPLQQFYAMFRPIQESAFKRNLLDGCYNLH